MIGAYLAAIALALWLALFIGGERAPSLLWAAPWIVVALFGLFLQYLAYWANGEDPS